MRGMIFVKVPLFFELGRDRDLIVPAADVRIFETRL